MQLIFKNLMLEVTRKCNMQCAHCMRGESQNVSMDSDTVRNVFQNVSRIEQLTLTGGEPSLAPDVLLWIIYYAKSNGIQIGSFFCATNAKEYSQEFVDKLRELYGLCERPDRCILTVSTDQFHATDTVVKERYSELPFYRPEKEHGTIPKAEIVLEGRAAENKLGRFTVPPETHIYDYEFKGFKCLVNDRVYINALGDVLLNPDMSYENQDQFNFGNVFYAPLEDLLRDCFHIVPDYFFPDQKQCVFSVLIKGEENTIAPVPVENKVYYANPQKAIAAYHSILNNLRYTPTDPKYGPIPDELGLRYIELPRKGGCLEATCIAYLHPNRPPRNVLVELERCPIEEEFNDVRF